MLEICCGYEIRKENKRIRRQLLKDPCGITKKLFAEPENGTLLCTKENLNSHIKEDYSDPHSNQPLPPLNGLKILLKLYIEFHIRMKDVKIFGKKARAESASIGNGLSFIVH